MGSSQIKNPRKIFSQAGGDSSLPARVTTLENNYFKIIYYASISSDTGQITIPTGATVLLDQFESGADAYVSTIVNSQPSGSFPQTAGGVNVDVTSFDASGNYTLSGVPSAYPVALIYLLKIKAKDMGNLTLANEIAREDLGKAPLASPAFTGTPTGPTAAIRTNTTQLANTEFVQANLAMINPVISGKWRGSLGVLVTSGGFATGTIYTNTYVVGPVHTVTQIRIAVTTGVSSQSIRLAIYDDVDGYPGNLLEESGVLPADSAGEISYTFSTPKLLTGKIVHMAFQHSNNSIAIRFWQSSVFILPRTGGAIPHLSYSTASAYGAFPSSFPIGASRLSTNNQPMLELLVQ